MDGAMDRLILGYSSHATAIDREEARTLFRNVREPIESEVILAQVFGLDSMVDVSDEAPPTVGRLHANL